MKSPTLIVLIFLLVSISLCAETISEQDLIMAGFNPSLVANLDPVDQSNPSNPRYETDDITWEMAEPATQTVCRAAIGRIGNYVYIFGGQGTGGGSTALAFNLTTELWEPSTPAPTTGSNWNGCVVNDSIMYVLTPTYSQTVQKFVPIDGGPTGTWYPVTPFPVSSSGMAVAWDGDNYIYTGGTAASPYGPQCFKFDVTTETFTAIASLPEGRGWAGGSFINGKFYVFGGSNTSYQYTNTTYEYNPSSNTWSTKAPMLKALSFNCFNTATVGNYAYLIGGGGGNATSIPSTDTVQVYDPVADSWSYETPRMNAYGTNAATFVEGLGYIIDIGGRDLNTTYNETWIGQVTGLSGLYITLTPHNPPIQIPGGGGSFTFDLLMENLGENPLTFDGWTYVIFPNGLEYPLITRLGINLAAGGTIEREMTQNVPASTIPGVYEYVGIVGEYPDDVWDSDSFEFEKLLDEDGGISVNNWNLYGWDEPQEIAGSVPVDFTRINAAPNPFNHCTSISYKLQAASYMELKVYDITGREIVQLINEYQSAGNHEIIFDAKDLVSGVYFVRLTIDGGQSMVRKIVLMK